MKKNTRHHLMISLGAVIFPVLSSCGLQEVRKLENPEYVIMTPDKAETPIGKDFAGKHQESLHNIFELIHARYNSLDSNFLVASGSYALGLYPEKPGGNVFYFGTLVLTADLYNINRTNFNQRAATVFTKHARKLLQDLTSEEKILKDKNVKGVMFFLGWKANQFSGSGLDFVGADIEGIKLFASSADCLKFLNDEISNTQFIKKSKIIWFKKDQEIGKIELDLKESL